MDLPVPFFQPFPQCNPTVYPDTKLVTTFVGSFKGKDRNPFPFITAIKPKSGNKPALARIRPGQWGYDGRVEFETTDKKVADFSPLKVKIKTCNTAGNVCNEDFSWNIDVNYDKCLNRVKLIKESTKIADMEASVGNSTAVI